LFSLNFDEFNLNWFVTLQHTTFFTEQLTAFEIWLDFAHDKKKAPEQLPIVLQVLLSQTHRLRALLLLGRFLDLGSWAVNQVARKLKSLFGFFILTFPLMEGLVCGYIPICVEALAKPGT